MGGGFIGAGNEVCPWYTAFGCSSLGIAALYVCSTFRILYHIRVRSLIRVAQPTTLCPNPKFHVKSRLGVGGGVKTQFYLRENQHASTPAHSAAKTW